LEPFYPKLAPIKNPEESEMIMHFREAHQLHFSVNFDISSIPKNTCGVCQKFSLRQDIAEVEKRGQAAFWVLLVYMVHLVAWV